MPIIDFQPQPGESILHRATSHQKWYVIVWKIGSGLVGIAFLTAILYSWLAGLVENIFISILPVSSASLLTKLLFLGLLPLAGTIWVAEDVACTLIGEFILTNQRIWVRGSPYPWSQSATPLENIVSMKSRRDAIFIRNKGTKKIQVLMLTDGDLFVKAYEQINKK